MQSLIKYLLSTYYVLGMVLDADDIETVTKQSEILASMGFTCQYICMCGGDGDSGGEGNVISEPFLLNGFNS